MESRIRVMTSSMFSDKEEKVPSLQQSSCHRILSCSREGADERENQQKGFVKSLKCANG